MTSSFIRAATTALLPGMYVRVPLEEGRSDRSYREYLIGQLQEVDESSGIASVSARVHSPGEPARRRTLSRPLSDLSRARILPGSRFVHLPSGEVGEVLVPRSQEWEAHQLLEYFVTIDGRVEQVPESEIDVAGHRQDPDPRIQMARYELHHPNWRPARNRVVEIYNDLQASTLGMQDLVSSRVRLLAHQADAIATVLSDPVCRYVLADEVGLGKTIEACVILKSLRRRFPGLLTLIIVPRALVHQWHQELNGKFWLDFEIFEPGRLMQAAIEGYEAPVSAPGMIVSTEDILEFDDLAIWLTSQSWGLLITDESHHLARDGLLFERVRAISRGSERALVLSATPIQRRAEEYFSLLQIMDPERYEGREADFALMLAKQSEIVEVVSYLAVDMNERDFDPEEFEKEMERLVESLDDPTLTQLVAAAEEHGLPAAREALAYVSSNYRIESSVIRNRRAFLDRDLMPQRTLDKSYSYQPSDEESEMLETLYDYVDQRNALLPDDAVSREYGRLLLHAFASSPGALLQLLQDRRSALEDEARHPLSAPQRLAQLASPREEADRVLEVVTHAPRMPDEAFLLTPLLDQCQRWHDATEHFLKSRERPEIDPAEPHRLAQVLRAVSDLLRSDVDQKILLFSSWTPTIEHLWPMLRHWHGSETVARFDVTQNAEDLQEAADRFQADDRCRLLLCDELGGEGRNFQIADTIIHIDIPWTPAQLEQRIGRVDRLGRSGCVRSMVPYAKETLEHDLFRIWNEAFGLFTQSLSGLEIALEDIQDELLMAIVEGARTGLSDRLTTMRDRAADLRDTVERERHLDRLTIDHQWRKEFDKTSDKYRDGSLLRDAFLEWADMGGLTYSYDPASEILWFTPSRFNQTKMYNAHFVEPPNMERALRRSRNPADLNIRGTYNRDIAVRREDLVFFAPGDDPWTDALVANAMEADRGRCAAILRNSPDYEGNWQGLELVYGVTIDPRPLLAAGYHPMHLLRAHGYLHTSYLRLLVDMKGNVISPRDRLHALTSKRFHETRDRHLGRRGGSKPMLSRFRKKFTIEKWHAALIRVFQSAEAELEETFSFMAEVAKDAEEEFARQARARQAVAKWQSPDLPLEAQDEMAEYEAVSSLLVQVIARPMWRLESVCFWMIRGGRSR